MRERKYRVVKPAEPDRGAAHSAALPVTVFSWRSLAAFNPATNTWFTSGTQHINGVTYEGSLFAFLFAGNEHFNIDINLNRGCKTLTARFGISDNSPTGSTGSLELSADGVQRFSGSYGLTQSQEATFDVTGVFRVSIAATSVDGGIPVVASPQVLCSF